MDPLGKPGDPFETTLWVPSRHTQFTVVPAWMITAAGTKRDPPAVNNSTCTDDPAATTAPSALNEADAPEVLPTKALAVCVPPPAPSVQTAVALPSPAVTDWLGERLPLDVCHTTDWPPNALPDWVTTTRSGRASAEPTAPTCPSPDATAIVAGGGGGGGGGVPGGGGTVTEDDPLPHAASESANKAQ